ncbi:GNAT family N-acetyltransferase [Vibrio neptunius]|uniref:GNAT family N-acetyltransferase n=1 Tax=Vibrio neptunius TaxID=170651 RepID=A0ABS3A0F1_9VIBR|nr:GNAT family N-acetyltransferase [Vibrio neptunius]MBN3493147.1 GNAT family N-acetyltransferase [Vibrio neptunius]MBN3515670.1 GNAT family N-acetyltransferase [Vibrio neptunius]MBN3549843.1 GNAT family N-acetyltransferase [Vibrio neptunius]MBN3577975.1 GNAT family N-acetyltransferase [Vibrio neptunius]MCH9871639.1 GNAT family N-acetyltransferase [Vibrio neptunius]
MQEVKIRAAQPHDLEQLNDLMFRLHDEHHNQCSEHFKLAEEIEQEKSIGRYLDDPECIVLVANYKQRIVGFISGHFCELTSSVSRPVQMGSIDELYVLPECRKSGIAKQLCELIEQRFDDCGVKQIFVEVWHFNGIALDFYKEFGFEHHIHWLRKPVD